MKWISFQANSQPSFGLVTDQGVADAGKHTRYTCLKDAIAADALPAIADDLREVTDHAISDVTFLPVIPNPAKILCVGLNYRAHQEETGRGGESYPTVFTRFSSSQIGHNGQMLRPNESSKLDYEGEIAMIIGKRGRRIGRAAALQHFAGFSCYNDGSIRDYQRHTSQFTPGKNFDGTGGFGPWMMTADEIGDLKTMEITTRLNGEVMQNATAAQMVFDFESLIEYCSTWATLEPGDVIVTGTPGGVGVARDPRVFMDAGDVVEIAVSPIGTLRNVVAVG